MMTNGERKGTADVRRIRAILAKQARTIRAGGRVTVYDGRRGVVVAVRGARAIVALEGSDTGSLVFACNSLTAVAP